MGDCVPAVCRFELRDAALAIAAAGPHFYFLGPLARPPHWIGHRRRQAQTTPAYRCRVNGKRDDGERIGESSPLVSPFGPIDHRREVRLADMDDEEVRRLIAEGVDKLRRHPPPPDPVIDAEAEGFSIWSAGETQDEAHSLYLRSALAARAGDLGLARLLTIEAAQTEQIAKQEYARLDNPTPRWSRPWSQI
jgi:hypothetical protein